MKNHFLFAAAIFCSIGATAQCPVPTILAVVQFSTQAQIDGFASQYPNCTQFDTLVTINGNGITSLAGLSQIKSFQKGLTIGNLGSLKNLHGLENVEAVGRALSIKNCSRLKNLEQLTSLQSVGEIAIEECDSLENLRGLEKIDSVAGHVIIWKCHRLENLDGLDGLKKIGGQLGCLVLHGLKSLNGLGSLAETGFLSLSKCTQLSDVSALLALKSTGGLTLWENDSLQNLSGLQNLAVINGSLRIQTCPKITDLKGIEGADLSGLTHLTLRWSPALSFCAQQNICDYIKNGGAVTIDSNMVGCNSTAEILNQCAVPTSDFSPKTAFQIFPNPISDGQPLQISLENDFFGKVKIEILSLDGRIFSSFQKEKTVQQQVFQLENLPMANQFFMRVSDGKMTATRLILKF